MTATEALALLEKFRLGKVTSAEVLHAFQAPPIQDLGFAQLDMHRALRKNFPEVVFGEGKTPHQVAEIARTLSRSEKQVLITRVTKDHAAAVRKKNKTAV